MKLLLDTHVFLWYICEDNRLPVIWRDSIASLENQVFLSVASIWEAVVKYKIGKLTLPSPPEAYLPEQRKKHQIASLSIDEGSISHLANLPDIHRDLFDRILICQTIEHGLILVTVDEKIRQYPVHILSHP